MFLCLPPCRLCAAAFDRYRLDQIFSQTMWYGTNALKVTSEYTGSLGYADQPVAGMRTVSNPAVVGEVANEDYYLKVKAGTLQSDTYGANLGTGVLNVGLSYQTEWNGKTTRSHCFTPYPHQGVCICAVQCKWWSGHGSGYWAGGWWVYENSCVMRVECLFAPPPR